MFNNRMKQINNVSPIAIIKNISNTIKNSDYVKSITKDSKSGLGTVKEEEEEIYQLSKELAAQKDQNLYDFGSIKKVTMGFTKKVYYALKYVYS